MIVDGKLIRSKQVNEIIEHNILIGVMEQIMSSYSDIPEFSDKLNIIDSTLFFKYNFRHKVLNAFD